MKDEDVHLQETLARGRQLDLVEAVIRNLFKRGRVVERDKDKGARLECGTDDDPDKSAWGQLAERSGVERSVPRLGQQCLLIAPFGDQQQGILIPFGHCDDHPNPATDVDEDVIFKRGKIRLSVDKDGKSLIFENDKVKEVWEGAKKTVTVDGNTTIFEKDTITFPDGSKVRHGDRNIGKDHIHSGVMSGGAKTQQPDQ